MLRKAIGQQLRYLRRNLNTIEHMLDHSEALGQSFPLSTRDQRIYWVIQHIYAQQEEMRPTPGTVARPIAVMTEL